MAKKSETKKLEDNKKVIDKKVTKKNKSDLKEVNKILKEAGVNVKKENKKPVKKDVKKPVKEKKKVTKNTNKKQEDKFDEVNRILKEAGIEPISITSENRRTSKFFPELDSKISKPKKAVIKSYDLDLKPKSYSTTKTSYSSSINTNYNKYKNTSTLKKEKKISGLFSNLINKHKKKEDYSFKANTLDYGYASNKLFIDNTVKEKKRKKLITIVVICFLVFVIVGAIGFSVYNYLNNGDQLIGSDNEVIETPEYAPSEYHDIWLESYNRAYNREDFICQILFDSGIINEPVVQSIDNNYYLRRDFETNEYRVDGPVYVDYECKVGFDNNTVLYGHNLPKSMDPEQITLFTPLHLLEKKKEYQNNKLIHLIFDDRVEEYVVSDVYRIEIIDNGSGVQYLKPGEPLYYYNNYSEEEFNEYMALVKERELYDTGITLDSVDKLLTMQTCYEDTPNKLIVIAKLVKTLYYEQN